MQHSPTCIEAFARHGLAMVTFAVKWPDYCRSCEGWGYFSHSYDPSPAGVSLGSGFMVEADPCDACTGADPHPFCARCHAVNDQWLEGEDSPCTACGWNWGKNQGDTLPPEPECHCYLDD